MKIKMTKEEKKKAVIEIAYNYTSAIEDHIEEAFNTIPELQDLDMNEDEYDELFVLFTDTIKKDLFR